MNMSTITKADMYGMNWPDGSDISAETSGIEASGAKALSLDSINNKQIFIALILMIVVVRVAYDYLP